MRLPPSPDSRWALAWLVCLLVLLLLLGATRSHGQTVSESGPPSLSANLAEAEQALQALVTRLETRQRQVNELQANLLTADEKLRDLAESLATLRAQLEAAQSSLQTSQADLVETSNLLDSALKQYDALETKWQAYRKEVTTQVAGLETNLARARRWVIGFGVATVIGVVVSVVLAIR
jgi:Skp family chaperone for outer membrane proteins